MKPSDVLTPQQLEICQQEKAYYQRIGVEKNLLQIAFEHNFIHKKEKKHSYNLEILKKYEILVVNEDSKYYYIECKKLIGKRRLEALEEQLHKKIIQKIVPVREFDEKFELLLSVDPDILEKKIKQFNAYDADDIEVLDLFMMVLKYGVKNGVSDIHINSYSDVTWLRHRQNGKVTAKYLLNEELTRRFTLVIKEKSNVDLIDTQTPKSGGFTEVFDEDVIDFRVEIAPAQYGENIVIRILDKTNNAKELSSLFPKEHPMSEHVMHYANEKNGFFLVVGPTGSGKTTTLNAILTQRDRVHEIIYTIEDPIEYKIDFITQYQINESIDFTFASAMKSIMRQDPDVIVIGEMRDKESVQSALKASHSGHMVFSTLHTTSAFMSLERIRDEGGDLFILAYALSGVIAQRLVPTLCGCKDVASDDEGKKYFKSDIFGYEKKGCIRCNFTGYAGRVLLTDMVFIPAGMKARYKFYLALKEGSVLQAWDELITFSYYESAQYLFNNGLCDYDTLSGELLSLGYSSET